MVITSPKKLEIGRIYSEEDIPYFEYDAQLIEKFRFLVLREATRTEYWDLINEMYEEPIRNQVIEWEYFYKISMD